jgi:hypothetical protein
MDSFVASAASVNLGLVHPTSSPLAVSAAARGPRGAQPQPPYERALTENRFPVSGLGAPDDTGGNTPRSSTTGGKQPYRHRRAPKLGQQSRAALTP